MQFLSLAIAQALLATAMAVPVANSLFSLTAFDAELFPEGKALTAKADGTIWLAAPNGEEQLLVASLSEDNLIHGLQVRPDHSLVAGTAGNDSFTLTSDASLTEHGVNKATVCVAQNGEAQMFWGDAVCDNKHAVTVRANPITEASVDNLHLKNNFCFCGGCSRNQAPKCAPPPQRAPPCPPPAPKCAPPPPPPRVEPCQPQTQCSGNSCGGDCGSCLECGGCPFKCGCCWKDILCPSKWCGICKNSGSDCCCETVETVVYTRAPAPRPTRTVTVVAQPPACTPVEPCNQCGSSSCGGGCCPAEKCGCCFKDVLDCICPMKKGGCGGDCNPPCEECVVVAEPPCAHEPPYVHEPGCEHPTHHKPPHTVVSTVTFTASPSPLAQPAVTSPALSAELLTDLLTTTRTHFVTLSSAVGNKANAAITTPAPKN